MIFSIEFQRLSECFQVRFRDKEVAGGFVHDRILHRKQKTGAKRNQQEKPEIGIEFSKPVCYDARPFSACMESMMMLFRDDFLILDLPVIKVVTEAVFICVIGAD